MAAPPRRTPRARPPSAAGLAALALAALLAAGAPAPVAAQADGGVTLLLPFDLSQGAITNADGVTPYVAAVRLQVALGFGTGAPLRVGPVAAVRFANPDWALAGGVRVQWLPLRFGLGGGRWGVGVQAEQLWDTADHRPAAVGLVADIELVRLAASLLHDWSDRRTGFELGLGTDLRSVWAVLFPAGDDVPFEDIP